MSCLNMETSMYCVMQQLQIQQLLGETLHNEYDFPLMTLTHDIYVVTSHVILTYVSVVHQYDSRCTISHQPCSVQHERELVTSQKLVFKHDYFLYESIDCSSIF